MSIISIEHLKDRKIIGLWHISETLEILKSMIHLSEQDELHYNKRKTLSKKKQWLASRILLQQMYPNPCYITYDSFGKPFDSLHQFNLSISHSDAYCSVYIDPFSPVGVDVQKMKIPFRVGLDYFLNDSELKWIDPSNDLLINLIWSAKETIYKYAGIYALNFKEAINIVPFDLKNPNPIVCILKLPDQIQAISVSYRFFEDYVYTYTV
jgi:4'-phosphopantetheinyl transferase